MDGNPYLISIILIHHPTVNGIQYHVRDDLGNTSKRMDLDLEEYDNDFTGLQNVTIKISRQKLYYKLSTPEKGHIYEYMLDFDDRFTEYIDKIDRFLLLTVNYLMPYEYDFYIEKINVN